MLWRRFMNGLTTMIQGSINTTRIILPFIDDLNGYNAPPLPSEAHPYLAPTKVSRDELLTVQMLVPIFAILFGCFALSFLVLFRLFIPFFL
jgi:hypothetical protein